MSIQMKRRIFSGVVCEQEVYRVSRRGMAKRNAIPRIRFQNEAEYEAYKERRNLQRFVRLINTNFTAAGFYATLTFDNEHEVYTFDEARKVRDNYIRRVKYANPDAKIVAVMGRGKSTARIHLHLIAEGLEPWEIISRWNEGDIVDCRPLRAHNYYNGVDHGQDYTALAVYLWNHWTPKQGGAHYYATRNMQRPVEENPTAPAIEYSLSRPPRTPRGYTYVRAEELAPGVLRFTYIKTPPPDPKKGQPKVPLDTLF